MGFSLSTSISCRPSSRTRGNCTNLPSMPTNPRGDRLTRASPVLDAKVKSARARRTKRADHSWKVLSLKSLLKLTRPLTTSTSRNKKRSWRRKETRSSWRTNISAPETSVTLAAARSPPLRILPPTSRNRSRKLRQSNVSLLEVAAAPKGPSSKSHHGQPAPKDQSVDPKTSRFPAGAGTTGQMDLTGP